MKSWSTEDFTPISLTTTRSMDSNDTTMFVWTYVKLCAEKMDTVST